MENRIIKEVPWEASLFFIGWVWLGLSMFGMTLVNIVAPNLSLYHFIVGTVYLIPMLVIGFKTVKSKNINGIPLLICSAIAGIWAILLHMKMNLEYDYGVDQFQGTIFTTLLLVAIPLSYYFYACSFGCENSWKISILKYFAIIEFIIILIANVFGMKHYGLIDSLLVFSFTLLLGPLLGVLYIWEIMSNSE